MLPSYFLYIFPIEGFARVGHKLFLDDGRERGTPGQIGRPAPLRDERFCA